ncbi:MAG: helix-turn-helix domain-containing protein [Paracoccaceae bacterium]
MQMIARRATPRFASCAAAGAQAIALATGPNPPKTVEDLFAGSAHFSRAGAGRALLIEGDPADVVHQIASGVVRCCTFTENGRRQIFRFAMAGDILGFADLERWHFTAEAVDPVLLRSIPRARLERALEKSPSLQRDLRRRISEELTEREQHMAVLAFEPAEKRVIWFLAGYSRRCDRSGFLPLPMTRQEIGDFLGLTLETVSRAFSALKRANVIEMQGADRFRLIEAAALAT